MVLIFSIGVLLLRIIVIILHNKYNLEYVAFLFHYNSSLLIEKREDNLLKCSFASKFLKYHVLRPLINIGNWCYYGNCNTKTTIGWTLQITHLSYTTWGTVLYSNNRANLGTILRKRISLKTFHTKIWEQTTSNKVSPQCPCVQ